MKFFIIFLIILIVSLAVSQNAPLERVKQLSKMQNKIYKMEKNNFARRFSRLQKPVVPDSTDYDQYYYDLDFTITTSPNNLEGNVTGYFKSKINGLNQIKLNFDSRDGITPWANFNVSGNVSTWTHSNWILKVDLDQTYNMGETFTVSVTYSGVPREGGLDGFSFDVNSYGDPVVSTLSEPYLAQTWWPCKDDPADKLDSARIAVTVADNMVVASNGLLKSEISNPNNTKTFVWKEKYPITTYLISLAISNYTTFSDSFEYSPGNFMPIDYFVYPQQYNSAQSAFQPLPVMLDTYSTLFGLYPFIEEKYGHAVFEWGGAMEHQTCTSIGGVSTNWESIYAHELAHQWFGDLVTCHDWHNIWMNEGFATYSEALWMESAYGGSAAYHTYINETLNYMSYWADEAIYRYDITDPWGIFSWTVYVKGMWVLHMLRHIVGENMFFEILHDYPNDPQFFHKDVTTEQFRDFCESKSGIDLDWFFQQWIYLPSYPRYEWGYFHYQNNNQDSLYLQIDQTQINQGHSHLYKMPVDIVVQYAGNPPDTLIVWDSLLTQEFRLPLSGTPQSVSFDPEKWVLKTATQVTVGIEEPVNLISEFNLLQNYPNPFNSTTVIPFSLDASGHVTLEIYDVTGRKVRTLADGFYNQGELIIWEGNDDNNRAVASGVYVYRIFFSGKQLSRKMLLVR